MAGYWAPECAPPEIDARRADLEAFQMLVVSRAMAFAGRWA
jgi:hypothetical protein